MKNLTPSVDGEYLLESLCKVLSRSDATRSAACGDQFLVQQSWSKNLVGSLAREKLASQRENSYKGWVLIYKFKNIL